MDMRNCQLCKRVFTYAGSPICPDCARADNEVFEAVRLYVKEHPENSLAQVSSATEVSIKKIMRYVKEGRLEISKGMQGEFLCENCGKPISKGRYCPRCLVEINHQVKSMFTKQAPVPEKAPEKKSDGKSRMYTRIKSEDKKR